MAGNAQIIVEFVSDLTKLKQGAKDVETAGKSASKGLDWKGVAKWAGGAAVLGGAAKFVVDATKSTVALAKATMGLQRATGLDTKTASEWVQLLQAQRGVDTGAFTKSVVKMSGAMETWRTKGAAAPSLLKDLGVSFAAVQKGDTGTVLQQVADGLSKIKNPAQRAVAAQKLFGKSGQALLPILGNGADALNKNLSTFDKYGATLDGNVTKSVAEMTKSQRDMDAAQKGLAITVGTTLVPAMASLFGAMDSVLQAAAPLLKNQTAMKIVIAVMAVAYAAYTAATIIATVATLGLNVAMLPQILLWGGIVLAVVAVIAVAILLAKNWDKVSATLSAAFAKIKSAALAVFNWIKANWPLLLALLTGPIGLAVLAIQKNWDAIRSAFNAGVSVAKTALGSLRDFINTAKSKITGYLDSITSAMHEPGAAAEAAVAAAKSAFNSLIKWLKDHVSDVGREAGKIASAIKSPINAVISAWNGISFTIPGFKIGGQKVGPLSVPSVSVPSHRIDFPDIPGLASGGILNRPTLALVGEGQGREIVTPEQLLRDIVAEHGRGDTFNLNLTTRTADAASIAYGFRRLELLRAGR